MSTNQGPINQMGSIHATESYSGTKKEWSTDTGYRFQVNHENKCSVKEARHRTPYCVVPLIQNPINRQIHWDTKQIIACQGGKEEGGVEADNDLLQGKQKYSKIACCDGWTIHEYTKKKIAHFKWLGFKVCTYCLRMQSIMEMAGWWFTSELFPISWENWPLSHYRPLTTPLSMGYILLGKLTGVSGN